MRVTTGRRVLTAAVLLLCLVGAGCSREFVPESGGGSPGVATSPDAARTKLSLALQDPCLSGDPRDTWPRCGRWEEEVAGIARSAQSALPSDPAVARSGTAVSAGRDAFVGRGCTAADAGPAVDPGACIGALLESRQAVNDLSSALRVSP